MFVVKDESISKSIHDMKDISNFIIHHFHSHFDVGIYTVQINKIPQLQFRNICKHLY